MRLFTWMVLAGCLGCYPAAKPMAITPGVDYVYIATEFFGYNPGAEVTLRLVNPTPGQYGYNLCNSQIQRLVADQWVDHRPVAEYCTMELRLVGPHGQARFPFRLERNEPVGQYRIQTSVHEMPAENRLVLTSPPFTVTPRGTDWPGE